MDDLPHLSPHDLFERMAHAVGLDQFLSRDQLARGFEEIQAELELLGLEVRAACARRQTFAEVVRDNARCPHAVRFQETLDASLRMPLPPALEAWVRWFFDEPEPPDVESLRTALVVGAQTADSPSHRALLRFVLFEAVRLNLRVMAHRHPEEVGGVGLGAADIDRMADETVAQWMAEEFELPEGCRPFRVMVVAALHRLEAGASELRRALCTVSEETKAELDFRVKVDAWFDRMAPPDALLVRNSFAEALGEPRLSVERLQERYPHILGDATRGTLDQRLSRARRRLVERGPQALLRTRPAMLDLLDEMLEQDAPSRSPGP